MATEQAVVKRAMNLKKPRKVLKMLKVIISDPENLLGSRDVEQWVVVPPTEKQTQRHNVIKSSFEPTAEAKRGVGSIADCSIDL